MMDSTDVDVTPIPDAPQPPTSVAPLDAAAALDRMAKAIEDLVTSNKADNARSLGANEAAAKRQRYTLVMMGAAVASLVYGTSEIRSTSQEVSRQGHDVAALADRVESIQVEQAEIKASAKEAADKAAEAAPPLVVDPAASASTGKPGKPVRVGFMLPAPRTSANAAPAPSASVFVPIDGATIPSGTTSTGSGQ